MILPRRITELLGDAHYLRLWLIGVFSMASRWLEMLVVGVFAVETTGSPVLVALLVILRMLPLAVFGSIVGTLADRLAPRLLLHFGLLLATLVSRFSARAKQWPGPKAAPAGTGGRRAPAASRAQSRARNAPRRKTRAGGRGRARTIRAQQGSRRLKAPKPAAAQTEGSGMECEGENDMQERKCRPSATAWGT